jgi:dihydroxyacid dehydratase/phosphogluconate dehydratase
MDLDAMTVTGTTWRERLSDPANLSATGVDDNLVILPRPRRAVSGVDVLRSNWFESAVVKISGMPERQVDHFDEQAAFVLFYESEDDANVALLDVHLLDRLRDEGTFAEADLRAVWRFNAPPLGLDVGEGEGLAYSELFDLMVANGTLKLAILIAAQGPEAFGMPEMFTPMQHINANRAIRKLATLISDGRYSGVSYGAAVGHVVPEAAQGGEIIRLQTGDLLHLRFRARRIDLLDPAAFREGRAILADADLLGARDVLFTERLARLRARQRRVAASNRMVGCTDASQGVVPQIVWDDCEAGFWDVARVAGVA